MIRLWKNELIKLLARPTTVVLAIAVAVITLGYLVLTALLAPMTPYMSSMGPYDMSFEIESITREITDARTRLTLDEDAPPADVSRATDILDAWLAMLAPMSSQNLSYDDWRVSAVFSLYDCLFPYILMENYPKVIEDHFAGAQAAVAVEVSYTLADRDTLLEIHAITLDIANAINIGDWQSYTPAAKRFAMFLGQQREYLPGQLEPVLDNIINLRVQKNYPPMPHIFGNEFSTYRFYWVSQDVPWYETQISNYCYNASYTLWGGLPPAESEQFTRDAALALYRLQNDAPPLDSMSPAATFNTLASSMQFLVCIALVILAGTIVSQEFSQGTIKLLLTQPYRRHAILTSKILAICTVGAALMVIQFLFGFVYLMLTDGPGTLGFQVLYQTAAGGFSSMPLILDTLLRTAYVLPVIAFCAVGAMMVSVLSRSGALAIGLGMASWFGTFLAPQVSLVFKYATSASWDFMRFIPYFNLNWTVYRLSSSENSLAPVPIRPGMSLGFSACVFAITLAVMLWTTYDSFCRRDVK